MTDKALGFNVDDSILVLVFHLQELVRSIKESC